MSDIGSIKPANTAATSKPIVQKQIQTRDAAIGKQLPKYQALPKEDRRKGQRRKNNVKVMLELRSGRDRRQKGDGASGVDITI